MQIRSPNDKSEQKEPRYLVTTIEAAESVRSLIHSLSMSLEEKIVMEDQINNLSHENNCLLDIISNSKKDYQKKLFRAYREFLERNIDAVNQ
jgi:CO dehydrogenase/acetyl-CoA synthase delta subunit